MQRWPTTVSTAQGVILQYGSDRLKEQIVEDVEKGDCKRNVKGETAHQHDDRDLGQENEKGPKKHRHGQNMNGSIPANRVYDCKPQGHRTMDAHGTGRRQPAALQSSTNPSQCQMSKRPMATFNRPGRKYNYRCKCFRNMLMSQSINPPHNGRPQNQGGQ